MRVALFTDQGAHYRFPIFRAINRTCLDRDHIDFYIPNNDTKGLNIIQDGFDDLNILSITNLSITGRLIYQFGVVSAIFTRDYDVVVLWGGANVLSNWLAILIAKLKKVKVVFWGHGLYGNEGFLKLNLRCVFYRFAELHFLYGSHAKRLIADLLPGVKTAVIYNSLDVSKIRKLFEMTMATDVCWDLIFVGRLTKAKRLDLLIDSLVICKARGLTLKILVVGDGAIQRDLRKLAQDQAVEDCFEWVGACYNETVLTDYFRRSKFCISPGNIGLMAMHALYNDTPVITHSDLRYQMPEAEVIEDSINGFLFERNSAGSLSGAIFRALEADVRSMSKNCFQSIEGKYMPDSQAIIFWNELYDFNISK
jgi:glycosyltransferase involved in cell wall biosynthesis